LAVTWWETVLRVSSLYSTHELIISLSLLSESIGQGEVVNKFLEESGKGYYEILDG
jgi:hypothetical protein